MRNWLKPGYKLDLEQTLIEFNELASMLFLGVGAIGVGVLLLIPDFAYKWLVTVFVLYCFAMYWLFRSPRAWLPMWPSFVQVPIGLTMVVSLQWLMPVDLVLITAFLFPIAFIFTFHFYARDFSIIALITTFVSTAMIVVYREVAYWPLYLVTTFGATLVIGLIVNQTVSRALNLANYDSLSGLMNRHFWEISVNFMIGLARREGHPLSIVFFDIDNFKRINDVHGHLQGDRVIKHVGKVLRHVCRESDIHGRWGGDEFAIALPNTTEIQANALIKRLQTSLGDIEISTGVISLNEDDDLVSIVQRADKAMYEVKISKRSNNADIVELKRG